MRETRSGRECLLLWVVVAVCGAGCANLEAVRKFARTSAATADYQQVVSDYVDSPKRQLRYQPESHQAELKKLIEAREKQRPRLGAAQKVVVDYMDALGELAVDKLPGLDDELDALQASLEGVKFIGEGDQQVGKETATAASTIAKLLSKAVFDGWRQAQLKELVKQTDPHLQTVVAGLRELLDKDLRASLENETVAVKKPFRAWMAAATSGNDPDGAPPVARILLDERLETVALRQDRLEVYLRVLDTIAKGHTELVANVEKLEFPELKKRLDGYSKDLKTAWQAIEALTKE